MVPGHALMTTMAHRWTDVGDQYRFVRQLERSRQRITARVLNGTRVSSLVIFNVQSFRFLSCFRRQVCRS